MNMRQHFRPILALVAAYAVGLQTILLFMPGPIAGSAGSVAVSLCYHVGARPNGQAPTRSGCDCIANCLAGCWCAPSVAPETAVVHLQRPMQTAVAADDTVPAPRPNPSRAYRSRAPPPT
jgi:hypothetical protein